MTLPNNTPPSPAPTFGITGSGAGTTVADLINRTQAAVTAALKAQVQASPGWTGATASVFSGLRRGTPGNPVSLLLAFGESFLQNAFGSSTQYSSLSALFTDAQALFSGKWSSLGAVETDIANLIAGIPGASTITDVAAKILAGAFTGLIPANLLPLIPVSHIAATNPNLLLNGSFQDAISLQTGGTWTWDGTTGKTTLGSAKAVANGALQALNSNLIPVTQGQTFNLSGWVQWSGLTAAAGNALALAVQPVYQGSVLGTTTIQTIANPAAAGGWTQLSGTYTVPAGVDNIGLQVAVLPQVTAGSVWFDDLSATKTGNLSGGLVNGVTGTVAADLQAIADGIHQGTGGAGTGNPLTVAAIVAALQAFPAANLSTPLADTQVPGIGTTVDNIVQAINGWGGGGYDHPASKSAMANLTGSVSTTAARLDAYIQSQSPKPSTSDNFARVVSGTSGLGTNWSQTRSNTNAHWECNNNAVPVVDSNGSCDMFNRWVGTWQPTVDYMKSSATLATAPQRGWPATNFQGRNFVFCRADSALSNMVWVDWNITGAWFLYKRISGTDTVMASGTTSSPPTAGSVMTLETGQSIGSTTRMYRVTLNNVIVQDWSACGDTTSNVGATYRFCGFGGHGDGTASMMLPGQVHTWVGAEI